MPELPEAEYMVRRLQEYATGVEIAKVNVLREGYAKFSRNARGKVAGYSRRAKNVLIHLANGWTLRIQLGMTGHVYWIPKGAVRPAMTRVELNLKDGGAIVMEDARVFGGMELVKTDSLAQLFAAYGPEPLDAGFRWQDLQARAAKRRGPVKPFLLDQSRLAGLGNIWAAESLHSARILPDRALDTLHDTEWKALHRGIRKVLIQAIRNTYRVTSGPADFPEADLCDCNVYGKQGCACRRCGTEVTRIIQAGRSTFYCPGCQS